MQPRLKLLADPIPYVSEEKVIQLAKEYCGGYLTREVSLTLIYHYNIMFSSLIVKGNDYVSNRHHTPFMDDRVILSHIHNLLRLVVLQW